MASKILVTTDFSPNSRAGVRFAIQLAAQSKQSLVFYHCMPYLRPTRWTDAQYQNYSMNEKKKVANTVQRFVLDIYKSLGIARPKFESYVDEGPDVSRAIIAYAREIGAKGICIGTRGAGRLKKLVGTHATAMIQGAPLPVYVVPKNYRRSPLKRVLYATDLNDIGTELKQVRDLAKALKAKVSVYHYDYLVDVDETRLKLKALEKKYKAKGVNFYFRKYNVDKSLAYHLIKDIRTSKASLAVLFTNQKRGWFDRIFLSSKSVDVVYDSSIPLLIIPKA